MADQFNYQSGQPQGQPPQGQAPYQQPPYPQTPYPQQGFQNQQGGYPQHYSGQYENNEQMTVGDWIVTYLLMIIPIANLVLLFIWAFGSDTKKSKKSWAKATLIFMAVGIVLSILISTLVAIAGFNMFNGMSRYSY